MRSGKILHTQKNDSWADWEPNTRLFGLREVDRGTPLGTDDSGVFRVGTQGNLLQRINTTIQEVDPDIVYSADWDASGIHTVLSNTLWMHIYLVEALPDHLHY